MLTAKCIMDVTRVYWHRCNGSRFKIPIKTIGKYKSEKKVWIMDVMTPDTLNTSMIFNNAPVHLQKYKLNYYNRTIKKQ